MALAQWIPMPDLMRLREEMNRLAPQFLGAGSGEEGIWGQGTWTPPVDIYETGDAYVLEAELPGFTKEDVEIELIENRLTLRGERKRPSEVAEAQYHRRERAYGHFERLFVLPAMIDRDQVTASYQHGVLTLRLPKSEMAKPKRITISDTKANGGTPGR
jgi:HSP20 family protein